MGAGLGSSGVEWSRAPLFQHWHADVVGQTCMSGTCFALLWLEIGGWVRIASDGVKVKASVLNVRVNAEYGGPACVESTAILLVPILAACI